MTILQQLIPGVEDFNNVQGPIYMSNLNNTAQVEGDLTVEGSMVREELDDTALAGIENEIKIGVPVEGLEAAAMIDSITTMGVSAVAVSLETRALDLGLIIIIIDMAVVVGIMKEMIITTEMLGIKTSLKREDLTAAREIFVVVSKAITITGANILVMETGIEWLTTILQQVAHPSTWPLLLQTSAIIPR